jgi:hypothetical protein
MHFGGASAVEGSSELPPHFALASPAVVWVSIFKLKKRWLHPCDEALQIVVTHRLSPVGFELRA